MADTAEQTENQEQEKSTERKPSEQKSDDNQKAIDDAASSIAFFTSVSRLAFTAATAFERDDSLIAPVRVP